MTPTFSSRKFIFVSVLALFAATGGETTGRMPSRQAANPAFCSASEFRQFDFWLGNWDAFDVGKSAVIRAGQPIAARCSLLKANSKRGKWF